MGVTRLVFAALLIALAGAGAGPAAAVLPEEEEVESAIEGGRLIPVERPPEDELILVVHLGRYVLSDGLLGYLHRGGVLLPLEELTRTLDFPIFTDPATGQAEGWFLSENRRFFLDIARGEVTVEGRKTRFPGALVELHSDDIYVDTTLFSQWFPVDLEFDLSRLVVRVTSREPLPIEQLIEREKLRARLGRGARERPQYPRVDTPYRLWDWPIVDTNIVFQFRKDEFASTRDARYNTIINGDLLFMDSSLFLAGALVGENQNKLSSARLTLGRKDPDGELFGPLGLTAFSLGDVFSPQLPLVTGSRGGRGVTLSSFPLTRASEFDRTTLRGDLPLGWEVELYRNEVLLDFQSEPDETGRYEFVDVPLLFGNNIIRLTFYGPQGQTREEVQTFLVGAGLVPPGEQSFRIGFVQEDEDLIPIEDESFRGEAETRNRFVAEYERGLTRRFSVGASFASFPIDEKRRSFVSLGGRATLFGAFTRLDVSRDSEGGTAVQLNGQSNILGLNILSEHAEIFGLVSDRFAESDDSVVRRSRTRIDGAIPALWLVPRMPFSLSTRVEQRKLGRKDIDIANRLSLFMAGVALSNTLNLAHSRGGGAPSTTAANGSFLANSRWDNLSLRGNLSYAVHPLFELNNVSATADYRFTRDLSARFTVNRALVGEQVTSLSAGLNTILRNVAIGVNTTIDDTGNLAASLNLSFSLGREPRTSGLIVAPRGAASGGAVAARVFLDRNQNRRFDEGDEPLQGVRFKGARRGVETDENGVAFISGLGSYAPRPLSIDTGSLEDPFWVPTVEGYEIVPRPGKIVELEFPVSPTGEVDGTVFLRRAGKESEVSNVRLQLVDSKGEVVMEERSAFDGFYLFLLVPPGTYTVRISPEQVERLRLVEPPEHEIVITSEGDIIAGVDFVLERKPKSDQ